MGKNERIKKQRQKEQEQIKQRTQQRRQKAEKAQVNKSSTAAEEYSKRSRSSPDQASQNPRRADGCEIETTDSQIRRSTETPPGKNKTAAKGHNNEADGRDSESAERLVVKKHTNKNQSEQQKQHDDNGLAGVSALPTTKHEIMHLKQANERKGHAEGEKKADSDIDKHVSREKLSRDKPMQHKESKANAGFTNSTTTDTQKPTKETKSSGKDPQQSVGDRRNGKSSVRVYPPERHGKTDPGEKLTSQQRNRGDQDEYESARTQSETKRKTSPKEGLQGHNGQENKQQKAPISTESWTLVSTQMSSTRSYPHEQQDETNKEKKLEKSTPLKEVSENNPIENLDSNQSHQKQICYEEKWSVDPYKKEPLTQLEISKDEHKSQQTEKGETQNEGGILIEGELADKTEYTPVESEAGVEFLPGKQSDFGNAQLSSLDTANRYKVQDNAESVLPSDCVKGQSDQTECTAGETEAYLPGDQLKDYSAPLGSLDNTNRHHIQDNFRADTTSCKDTAALIEQTQQQTNARDENREDLTAEAEALTSSPLNNACDNSDTEHETMGNDAWGRNTTSKPERGEEDGMSQDQHAQCPCIPNCTDQTASNSEETPEVQQEQLNQYQEKQNIRAYFEKNPSEITECPLDRTEENIRKTIDKYEQNDLNKDRSDATNRYNDIFEQDDGNADKNQSRESNFLGSRTDSEFHFSDTSVHQKQVPREIKDLRVGTGSEIQAVDTLEHPNDKSLESEKLNLSAYSKIQAVDTTEPRREQSGESVAFHFRIESEIQDLDTQAPQRNLSAKMDELDGQTEIDFIKPPQAAEIRDESVTGLLQAAEVRDGSVIEPQTTLSPALSTFHKNDSQSGALWVLTSSAYEAWSTPTFQKTPESMEKKHQEVVNRKLNFPSTHQQNFYENTEDSIPSSSSISANGQEGETADARISMLDLEKRKQAMEEEMEMVTMELDRSNKELETIKTEAETSRKKLDGKDQLNLKTNALEETTKKLQAASHDRDMLNRALEETESSLENDLIVTRQKLQSIQNNRDQDMQTLQKLQDSSQLFQEALIVSQKSCMEKSHQIQALTDEHSAAFQEVVEYKGKNEGLQGTIITLQSDLEEKETRINDLLRVTAETDMEAIDKLEQTLKQVRREKESKAVELAEAERELAEKTLALQQMEAQLQKGSEAALRNQEELESLKGMKTALEDKLTENERIIFGLIRFTGKVEVLQDENAGLKQSVQDLQSEVNMLTQTLQSRKEDMQNKTARLLSFKQKLDLAKNRCREKEKEIAEIKKERDVLTRTVEECKSTISHLDFQTKDLTIETNNLKQDVQRLSEALEQMKKKYEEKVEEIRVADRVADEKLREKNIIICTLNRSAEKADKYKEEKDDLKIRLEGIQKAFENLKRSCVQKDEKIKVLEKEADEKRKEREDLMSRLREKSDDVNSMSLQIADLKQTVEQLRHELASKQQTSILNEEAIRGVEAAAAEQMRKKDMVIAGLSRVAAKDAELSLKNGCLKQSVECLQRDLQMKAQLCLENDRKLAEQEEKLRQLSQSNSENRRIILQQEAENERLKEQVHQTDGLRGQLQQQLSLGGDFQIRNKALQDELQVKTSHLELSKNNISGMNSAFTRLSKLINEKEEQANKMQQEISQLKGIVERLTTDNERYRKLNEQTLPLKHEAATLKGRTENLERIRVDMERQLKVATESLHEKERAVARLEVENQTYRNAHLQMSTLRERNEYLQLGVNQLQNQVACDAQILTDSRINVDRLQMRMADTEKQNQRYCRETQTYRDVIKSLEEQNLRLHRQLTSRNYSGTSPI